eukprot:TRINITY_DN2848_c0_g1_i3.p1 TRINITY_DN2848_c0_g1~~TRINITY_DN2848_c0_g1_i3.p1  ORF type:complete len:335 (+),score=56.04 TRINITY_DN2848_c0_g1_i3:92-1096(+)
MLRSLVGSEMCIRDRSYAAHVYGHGTVFVWFTRTLMAVFCCFILFHLLKYCHQLFEKVVINVTAAKGNARQSSGLNAKPATEKKKPKRLKRGKANSERGLSTRSQERQTELDGTSPGTPSEQASTVSDLSSKSGADHGHSETQKKTEAQMAAETALENAKTEARLANERFQEAKKAEELAQSALATPRPHPPCPNKQLQDSSEQAGEPPGTRPVQVALPVPRSSPQQRNEADDSPSNCADDMTKGSYVPPHLREGFQGQGVRPVRVSKAVTQQARQRGRRGSDKDKDPKMQAEIVRPRPRQRKPKKDDDERNLIQQSMYLCLDLDDGNEKQDDE